MKKTERVDAGLKAAFRSPYWTESEAREVLEAWKRSGVSLSCFAREQALNRSRLQQWKRRLELEAGRTLHPVRVVVSKGLQGVVDGEREGSLELVLRSGRRVSVGAGFDASTLEELVRVVESWAC